MEVFPEVHKPSLRLECEHCGFRGTDYENVQVHMGSTHPESCDAMDAAGLGRLIFYQKSAKLFHCHKCFFTSKIFSNVYHHITAKHAASASDKCSDKPKDQLSKETEPQSTAFDPAEARPTPALPVETQKTGPSVSPEPHKSVPPALEPQDPGPISSEPQAPCFPAETSKTASVSSPECLDTASVVSELQKPAPASPESFKSALVSSKPQKHSPFADTGAPPCALSPESPVLATSPEPWGPSLTASPESRKPVRTASPEPRKPSPSESSEVWKPFPAITSEPRRPAPAVSPGSWKPGPPGSPRPWKSSPSSTSGPWKSSKPASSMSPGPWKPIPSVSPGPWKPAPPVSAAPWKSSVSSGSWKTPPTSPESWKSGPPELRKTPLTLSPELRRPAPPLSPEIRSPAGSPELRKPSPDQRKSSPASLDFSESQKTCHGSPDHWKSFITDSQKSGSFPETRKHASPGSTEPPKAASDVWKPVLSIDAEPRKSTLFPDSPKTVLPASPETRKRSLFPESRKHVLFPELPKPAVFSDAQKASELSEELQLEAGDDGKCDSLAQEGLLATPKKLLEDALFPSSKKLKKDSQENSDTELSSSEYIRTDLDTIDIKGQESSSDQEQVDVESIDFGKENKMEMSSPEQSKNVLQFTEEKEAFISEEEIAKYMKRGKGKYYCKICCCRAMKKGAVLHHLVNKHNVHSPYKCTICGKAFLLESLLKNHVAAHGQSLLKCPRCNFESNFPRGFKKHLTHCQSRHNEEANKKLMEALESPLEGPQM
ncbi:chromosome alignment-maintaining phosphoprotein 1 [Phodopus roborovskii]|uniref:Chromosome alignment-maintaining phosphoprotein 1 n=1 Tax=Phodopus roborovskii TaxID=109678 RepID=A0AAU9Z4S4_PHORO|nr:chromosome alignment-maintaining phosphoprotein 1 [Phodopus roborovskii]CAH6787072.1 Champ1 [Phodopus roborovskii]